MTRMTDSEARQRLDAIRSATVIYVTGGIDERTALHRIALLAPLTMTSQLPDEPGFYWADHPTLVEEGPDVGLVIRRSPDAGSDAGHLQIIIQEDVFDLTVGECDARWSFAGPIPSPVVAS